MLCNEIEMNFKGWLIILGLQLTSGLVIWLS